MNTLKLQKPMMHGPAVMRLQEMLDLVGYGLDSQNDGIYGIQTYRDVVKYQIDFCLEADGICGPITWEDLLITTSNHMDPQPGGGENPTYDGMGDRWRYYNGTLSKGTFVDRRGKHPRPRLYKCKRPWSQIAGVTLHQTGCEMPKNPAGWDRLNAHIGITQEGVAILVNDPTDFIWHAQGLSKNTIGIEIEGNYCGIHGDMRTLWKGGGGPHYLNSKMINALWDIRCWLEEEFERQGQLWTLVHAHRQSAQSRIADPGEEIWSRVGRPWCDVVLGATAGPEGWCRGTGRPIPKEWDVRYEADYYCKPGIWR